LVSPDFDLYGSQFVKNDDKFILNDDKFTRNYPYNEVLFHNRNNLYNHENNIHEIKKMLNSPFRKGVNKAESINIDNYEEWEKESHEN
jgi:hypothetical protein